MDSFRLELLTPAKSILDAEVEEVLVPAHDGEVGVLSRHEDFVGLLGTGPLKIVRDGNDYWYMVSSGIYEVRGGDVSIMAERLEQADQIDFELEKKACKEFEDKQKDLDLGSAQGQSEQKAYDISKARVDVFTRTELVN